MPTYEQTKDIGKIATVNLNTDGSQSVSYSQAPTILSSTQGQNNYNKAKNDLSQLENKNQQNPGQIQIANPQANNGNGNYTANSGNNTNYRQDTGDQAKQKTFKPETGASTTDTRISTGSEASFSNAEKAIEMQYNNNITETKNAFANLLNTTYSDTILNTQIQNINSQFDALIEQQKLVNETKRAFKVGYGLAKGISANIPLQTQTAEIQEVNDGIERLTNIEQKRNLAIQEAKNSVAEGKANLLISQIKAIRDIEKERNTQLNELDAKIINYKNLNRQIQKDELDKIIQAEELAQEQVPNLYSKYEKDLLNPKKSKQLISDLSLKYGVPEESILSALEEGKINKRKEDIGILKDEADIAQSRSSTARNYADIAKTNAEIAKINLTGSKEEISFQALLDTVYTDIANNKPKAIDKDGFLKEEYIDSALKSNYIKDEKERLDFLRRYNSRIKTPSELVEKGIISEKELNDLGLTDKPDKNVDNGGGSEVLKNTLTIGAGLGVTALALRKGNPKAFSSIRNIFNKK